MSRKQIGTYHCIYKRECVGSAAGSTRLPTDGAINGLPAMMGDDILLRARVGGRAVGESRKWRREEKFGRKMRNCESLSLLRSPTHRSSLLGLITRLAITGGSAMRRVRELQKVGGKTEFLTDSKLCRQSGTGFRRLRPLHRRPARALARHARRADRRANSHAN